MLRIEPRPLLCWNSRRGTKPWEPTDGNYWRPKPPYYPDTRQMMPGDVILFQPLNPTPAQKLSQWFQRAPFTHAAVYLANDHEICEAETNTRKVVLANLQDKLNGACILVRRVPGLSIAQRQGLAREAATMLDKPYSFAKIFRMVLQRIGIQAWSEEWEGVICSTLCEHMILALTNGRIKIRERAEQVVTPADLAQSTRLSDVQLEWAVAEPARAIDRIGA